MTGRAWRKDCMGRTGTSRGGLLVGALLIVLGAGALAVRETGPEIGWPAWVILPGLVLLLAAFAVPEPAGSGLAVVGGIVTAVGAVLAVQDATGTYASWAYAWALVAPAASVRSAPPRRADAARRGRVGWARVAHHRHRALPGGLPLLRGRPPSRRQPLRQT